MPRVVFVDTSAWVGYFVRSDQYHGAARRAFESVAEARRELVTTDYVIAETVTRVRGLSGLNDALKAWMELESGETVHVIDVDRELRVAAQGVLRKYGQIQLSLVDSVSIALLKRLGVDDVLTFDADFKKAGFRLLPPLGK